MRALYVETLVDTDMERLWELTQNPAEHQRWDLRFTTIDPEPGTDRFRYATRVLPGLAIDGVGVSTANRSGGTSALRFASEHPLSPIARGAGYWRYVATDEGIRFLTGYDYTARHRAVDRVFRPLMGWATAWSFDRLRLWAERGVPPERSLRNAVLDLGWRVAVAVAVPPTARLAAVVALAALPPLPTTPAARRCLRKPRKDLT